MSSMSGNRGAAGSNLQGGAAGGNIIPKGYRLGQIQQYSPEQMGLFKQLFSHTQPGGYLSKLAGGDEEAFQQAEAPMRREFGDILGQIGNRFSQFGTHLGQGSMSAQRGSGFKNTLGSAGMEFAERLGSQRQALQRRALQDLLGLSGELLNQRPTEQSLIKKKEPFWKQLLLGGSEAAKDFAPLAAQAAFMA